MILVIDNYDSFTYNLVQRIGEFRKNIMVYRNDTITVKDIKKMKPSHMVISPGPCTPKEASISNAAIQKLGRKIPILGVCLGHQCIGHVFGAKIIKAPYPIHGKVSTIHHDNKTIFKGLPKHFTATRYHSLIVDKKKLPDCLEVSATTGNLIMGIRHIDFPIEGVQFHPESFLTGVGNSLLRSFFEYYE